MRSLVLIGLALAFGTGAAIAQTPPKLNEKLLRAAMESELKDAESARFRSLKYKPSNAPGMWEMCGEVNAKNSYGGYTGFGPFYGVVTLVEKKPYYIVMSLGEVALSMCSKMDAS